MVDNHTMSQNQDSEVLENLHIENFGLTPKNFEHAVAMIKDFAFAEVEKEAQKKQLYFHNYAHAQAVQRRAEIIFNAIEPFWGKICQESNSSDSKRAKYLIDICAASHDMVQEFLPLKSPQTARQRETGVSENATINKLIDFIKQLNKSFVARNPGVPPLFTLADLEIIRKSISATICLFDTSDNSIYQPDLYNLQQQIALNARIIALADIGGLGIDGIPAYLQEMVRLLTTDGVYIVSTPQVPQTNHNPENPYHTVEFSRRDFETLLKQYFGKVEIYAQSRRQSELHYWLTKVADFTGIRKHLAKLSKLRQSTNKILQTTTFENMSLDDILITKDYIERGSEIVAVCRYPLK